MKLGLTRCAAASYTAVSSRRLYRKQPFRAIATTQEFRIIDNFNEIVQSDKCSLFLLFVVVSIMNQRLKALFVCAL